MSAKYIMKLLTLGDKNVGKSSIILRYSDNKFNERTNATIGIDFKSKLIQKGNEIIKVTIYDTAGQERFNHIIKSYYKGTNGVLLIYDITDRDSFQKINFWLEDLKNNADDINNIFMYLVGNKKDLSDKRKIDYKEASDFAKEKKLPYIEVSAKTGDNIKQLFDEMIKGTMINMLSKEKKENSNGQSIRLSFLDKEEKVIKDRVKCC